MYPETIDRFSKLPYYQQLYEILLGKIQRQEWQPGDMIPPESELVEIYQVSRNTVRQVLDKLVPGYPLSNRRADTQILIRIPDQREARTRHGDGEG